jgi:hypothetical protein
VGGEGDEHIEAGLFPLAGGTAQGRSGRQRGQLRGSRCFHDSAVMTLLPYDNPVSPAICY